MRFDRKKSVSLDYMTGRFFRREAPHVFLWPMNNAEQTDVSDHSLVAPGGGAGTLFTPAAALPTLRFVFLSDLFKKAPYFSAKLPLMRWIWAVHTPSSFSLNTNDVD